MKKFHVKGNEIIEEPWDVSAYDAETDKVTVRGYLFTFNEHMTKAEFKEKWLEWARLKREKLAKKAAKHPGSGASRYFALLHQDIVHRIEAIEKLEV